MLKQLLLEAVKDVKVTQLVGLHPEVYPIAPKTRMGDHEAVIIVPKVVAVQR